MYLSGKYLSVTRKFKTSLLLLSAGFVVAGITATTISSATNLTGSQVWLRIVIAAKAIGVSRGNAARITSSSDSISKPSRRWIPMPQVTPKPITSPSPTPSPTPTESPTPTPSPTPTATPTPTPTPTPAPLPTAGSQFYVSPDGSAAGDGSITHPWDLVSALSFPPAVEPGATIWLRGGTYTGTFVSVLAGTSTAPIIVRQYPGERAIIDKGVVNSTNYTKAALEVRGSWVYFWGFEIMNSYSDRNRISPYTGTVHLWRGDGVDVYASDVKFINMIFHDNGTGLYDKLDRTEVYGSVFFYNGNNHFEHGMYIGNSNGTKYVADNIVFDNAAYGIHSYSASTTSSQRGLTFEGNSVFNNGMITLDDQYAENVLVGGEAGVSAERIALRSNYLYAPSANAPSKNSGIHLGYADQNNKDVTVLDNYIACAIPLQVKWWQNVVARGNTIYTHSRTTEQVTGNLQTPIGVNTSAYDWDNNTYISGRTGGPAFTFNTNQFISFTNWTTQSVTDLHSLVIQNSTLRPTGVNIFVRPNKYEIGRGNITVYNWDLSPTVVVDIASLGLKWGDAFEVLDAQNYFGPPVTTGIYDGQLLVLPMNLTMTAVPAGNVERTPRHTAPEFAVFVVRKH